MKEFKLKKMVISSLFIVAAIAVCSCGVKDESNLSAREEESNGIEAGGENSEGAVDGTLTGKSESGEDMTDENSDNSDDKSTTSEIDKNKTGKKNSGKSEAVRNVKVIDETGEERTLSMAKNIDFSDTGENPAECDSMGDMAWAQIYQNHFYYAYKLEEYNAAVNDYSYFVSYTIYRDQGEKIGKFHLKFKDEWNNVYLVLHNDIFYVATDEGDMRLGYIDLNKGEMIPLNVGLGHYQKEYLSRTTYVRKNKSEDVLLGMDETCLYVQEFIIPLKGGNMMKKDVGQSFFVSNGKYIFYIDTKRRLHRISKNNLERDVILSKHKFSGVYCTEDKLYLKDCDSWPTEAEEDMYADDFEVDLYAMDFDGSYLKKVQRG